MRRFDWTKTPLGPIEGWSPRLRAAVDILLGSPLKMLLLWGSVGTVLYNDAFAEAAGDDHPHALGMPVVAAFPSMAAFQRGAIESVLQGESLVRRQPITFSFGGRRQRSWFDLSCSPVLEEDGRPAGVLEILMEVAERRHAPGLKLARSQLQLAAELRAMEDLHALTTRLLAAPDEKAALEEILEAVIALHGADAGSVQVIQPDTGALERVAYRGLESDPVERHAQVADYQAVQSTPLRTRRGEQLGTLSAYFREPHTCPARDLRLTDLYARHAAEVIARHQAERAVHESQGRLEALYRQASVGIAQCDLRGRLVEANDRYLSITGYAMEQLRGTRTHELTHPDDLPYNLQLHDRLVREGEGYLIEKRIRRADGEWIWVRDAVNAVRGPDGQPQFVVTICQDVTSERQAKEEAYRARDQAAFHSALGDALRGLDDPIEVQSQATWALGQHLKASRVTFAEVLPDLEIVVERDYTDGVPSMAGRYRFGDSPLLAQLQAGQTIAVPDVSADRSLSLEQRAMIEVLRIRAHIGVPLTREGRLLAILGVHQSAPREWTADEVHLAEETAERAWAAVERARAEAALRASESRLCQICDAMPVMIGWVRSDGAVGYVNPAWSAFTGLRPDASGMAGDWKSAIAPEDRPRVAEIWERALIERRPFELECRLRRSDGMYRWFLVSSQCVLAPDGTVAWWVHVGVDIHDRKEAERSSREADRRKDEFLATLAHELRNPLAPLRNALRLLRGAGSLPSSAELLVMMERQLHHVVRLVDDLLEVSRITRDKIELRREPVELANVLRSALETSGPLIEAASHQLVLTLPDEPVILDADPVRLAQVFANLLNNAAKYTEEGGGIWLTAQRSPDEVVVTVRDNGVGIPPEMLPRVFDLFEQGHPFSGRAHGGLGIGLTLARSLIELHGGRVEAHSDGPGTGSEFVVHLPLAQASPAPERVPPALPAVQHRILVVDDNRDAADSLAALLELSMAEVWVNYDGPSAVASFERHRPNIVLLDLGMPGMDGYEVARQIRALASSEEVTLIALTGWGHEEAQRQTREAGFDQHLVKPVDPDVLLEKLAQISLTRPPS